MLQLAAELATFVHWPRCSAVSIALSMMLAAGCAFCADVKMLV
jgi:hypothetical protein